MNHSIIYGAIGFILGGLTGGFVAGIFLGKEYKKRIDRLTYENEKLRETSQEKKNKEIAERVKKIYENKLSDVSMKEIVEKSGYSSSEDDDKDDDEDVDLEDVDFDDPFEGSEENDDDDDDIRLINKQQYEDDLTTKDSETLTYYQQDGILADQYDEMVANPTNIIGIDAIEKAEDAGDNDVLYVANDIEDKLYEILVNTNESFYRDVL